MPRETARRQPPPDHTLARREKEPPSSLIVIYAGQSARRKAFIQHCFPNSPVLDSEGGTEPDIEDVVEIMHGKLDHVLKGVTLPEHGKNWKIALIAADTRTSTLTVGDGDVTYLESRGKPKRTLDIRRVFEEMHEAGAVSDGLPYYVVRSASGVHVRAPRTEDRLVSDHTSTIELHPEFTRILGTHEGFEQYLEAAQDFYSSPSYTNDGTHPAIELTDISGGLSLPVFVKMKGVVAIDGTRFIDPHFPAAFRNALYNVAVGISPEILSKIQPRAHEAIRHWQWLNQVVEHALPQSEQ